MAGPTNPTDKPKPWVAKDWTTWTSDDCSQVLNNSPWSHDMGSAVQGRYGSSSTSVTLVSALPVCQAALREWQLQKNYDKMDSQKKQEFDQLHASDSAGNGDSVVINVINVSDRPPRNANAETGIYAPDAAAQIALRLADGTLVQPTQTKVLIPPSGIDVFGNETEYFFPRTVHGKPLYSPSDSFLTIVFGAPLIVDKKTKKVEQQDFRAVLDEYYSFKIPDLMHKSKLEY
jgi:hypothetical protein